MGADIKAGATFKAPLRYGHEGSKAVVGARHYLDGAPLRLVDALSIISDDPEQGTLIYGAASDCVAIPSIEFVASSDTFSPYSLRSGSANAATLPTQPNTVGGVLRVQTAAVADNDSALFKLVQAPFRYSATKRIWFSCRIALEDVNTGECTVGLVVSGYSPADMATLPTDGIFFTKAVTGTDFTFHVRNGGTSSTIASVIGSALVDDTFVELSFVVEDGAISIYVNGTKNATTIAADDANIPDTTDVLQMLLANATSAAATKYMDIDHFLVAEER